MERPLLRTASGSAWPLTRDAGQPLLADRPDVQAQHAGAHVRANKLLSREAFAQLALDYITFGMAYVERRRAMSGVDHSLAVPLAQYMRRGVNPGEFFQVRAGSVEHEFKSGDVF